MSQKIYNTLSGQKESIKKEGKINLFVCGPTVYDYSHIGHARTYIAFDIIVRYLKSKGWNIFYLQNITDVDDKIINKAQKQNRSPLEVAKEFENAYLDDMKKLGINSVDRYARVRNFIPELINQVNQLLKKGFAYETEKGIYFKVEKFKDYGKLSGQDIDNLEPAERTKKDEAKKDPRDFVIWKIRQKEIENTNQKSGEKRKIVNGEPLWNSPWGWGRPGWHIEDTAITESFFGPQYDLHGGAEDLKFPHHESEIALQESASGKKPFVKIWMHAGHLTIEGEKMSKSLNNFITIRDFLEDYSPEVLRWIVLSNHYRSKLDYTPQIANQAKKSLKTIKEFVRKLNLIKEKGERRGNTNEVTQEIQKTNQKIEKRMKNDFNTPEALSDIFELIDKFQKDIWKLNRKEAKKIKEFIQNKFSVFGFDLELNKTPKETRKLAKKREEMRKKENFEKADELRNKIEKLGYEVEDTPLGPLLSKKQ
ncbi:MAG: cysteine--tRNA ligase [Candidatus Magasanikbacteria bacterium]